MATLQDYIPTNWETGDLIDAEKMNHIEQQLDDVTDAALNIEDTVENVANKIVLVQDTQPTDEMNKIWVQPQSDEYQVPTMEEFTELKNDFNNSNIFTNAAFRDCEIDYVFEQGAIATATGGNSTSTTRIRNSGYLLIGNSKIIQYSVPDGYKLYIFFYQDIAYTTYQSNQGWVTGAATIAMPESNYFRFVIAKTNDAAITPEEAPQDLIVKTYDLSDTSLTLEGCPADAKAVGEFKESIKNDILAFLQGMQEISSESITWTLNASITSAGNISAASSTYAYSNKVAKYGFDIIQYAGPDYDANNNNVVFYIYEFTNDISGAINSQYFIKRTLLHSGEYVILDQNTESFALVIGRETTTNISITQDDVDSFFKMKHYVTSASSTFKNISNIIKSGTDINTITTPGQYWIQSGAVATTLLNYPISRVGLLYVSETSISNIILQTLIGDIYSENTRLPRIFIRTIRVSDFLATEWRENSFINDGELRVSRTELTESDDLNDLQKLGFYRYRYDSAPNNMPSDMHRIGGWIFVLRYPDSLNYSARLIQFVFDITGQIFQRLLTYDNDTQSWSRWSDWVLISSPNIFINRGIINNTIDINDITLPGQYYHGSDSRPQNIPQCPANTSGALLHFYNSSISAAYGSCQIYLTQNDSYFRYKISTGWQPWFKILSQDVFNDYVNAEHGLDISNKFTFAQGAIGSANGKDNTANYGSRIRSSNYYTLPSNNLYIYNTNSNFDLFVLCYSNNQTYLNKFSGWLTNGMSYLIPQEAVTIRIVICYSEDRSTTIHPENFDGQIILTRENINLNMSIPTLKLSGDITEMSKTTAVNLTYSYLGKTGTCKCKWQGSSSQRYPKKNYTISKITTGEETEDGFDAWVLWADFVKTWRSKNKILNTTEIVNKNIWTKQNGEIVRTTINSTQAPYTWGNRKKYCLKANWIDPSAARNVVAARLWGQVVRTRENQIGYLAEVNNGGAIDGYPCFVEINGENQGLYTFNTPKDEHLFNMGNNEKEYFIVGEVNEGTAAYQKAGGLLRTCTESMFYDNGNHSFVIEYPDVYNDEGYPTEEAKDTFDSILNSWNTMVTAALNSGADWETACADYLDIDSVIDYLIFACCIGGHDNMARNIIYGTYDGTKWFMSAYDLDTTFGSDPYGSHWFEIQNDRNQFAEAAEYNRKTKTYTLSTQRQKHRLFHLVHKYSREKLIARYKELRATVLSDDNIWYEFSNFINFIEQQHYQLDRDKWPTMIGTSTANIHQYVDFYKMHCKRLDEEIEELEATLTE